MLPLPTSESLVADGSDINFPPFLLPSFLTSNTSTEKDVKVPCDTSADVFLKEPYLDELVVGLRSPAVSTSPSSSHLFQVVLQVCTAWHHFLAVSRVSHAHASKKMAKLDCKPCARVGRTAVLGLAALTLGTVPGRLGRELHRCTK